MKGEEAERQVGRAVLKFLAGTPRGLVDTRQLSLSDEADYRIRRLYAYNVIAAVERHLDQDSKGGRLFRKTIDHIWQIESASARHGLTEKALAKERTQARSRKSDNKNR